MDMVEVNLVNKKIGNFALHHMSFSLPAGYILGIIGRNGAGKTSLLHLLMGLYKQDAGEINVFGMNYEDAEKKIKNNKKTLNFKVLIFLWSPFGGSTTTTRHKFLGSNNY